MPDVRDRFARLSGWAALAALAASVWWVLASIGAMAAMPVLALDRSTILAVLGATPLGWVMGVRMIALAVAVLAIRRLPVALAACAGCVALATAAWTGHAGATEGAAGFLHRTMDVVHLLAAATWLAALVIFVLQAIGGNDRKDLARQLEAFAPLGTLLVGLLAATGLVNAVLIAGWPPDWSTRWIALLAVKLALFAAMLVLAAGNRWKLAPRLAQGLSGSLRALSLSLSLETGAALAILGLVAVLGTFSAVN
jgi:putative copper resistance protein D